MLQLKNITVTHKKDMREIIRDFSFSLRPEDKAVIIGEEGNGKSTLLKLIYQEAMVEGYADYTGEIIKGQARLGYLAQELPPGQKEMQVAQYSICTGFPHFLKKPPRSWGNWPKPLAFPMAFFMRTGKSVHCQEPYRSSPEPSDSLWSPHR